MSSTGFRSVDWDPAVRGTSISAVEHLQFLEAERPHGQYTTSVTLESLLEIFMRSRHSLLFDADVERKGTIRIRTTSSAHPTSDAVIDALTMHTEGRASKRLGTVTRRERYGDTNDTLAEIRRHFQLRPEHVSRSARCHQTRGVRRMIHRH